MHWEHGVDVVKVFPATAVGPQYFRDIHGPLPQVPLLPTGGVSIENAADFIKAGARSPLPWEQRWWTGRPWQRETGNS